MKIFLDAGHGGSDSGAVAFGLVEKKMNLVTVLECSNVLKQHGLEIKLSRDEDKELGISTRTNLANKWGADYFVSIHYNAGGGDGVEAIHSVYCGNGEKLAKKIVSSINLNTGQNLRPRATYYKVGSGNKDYFGVIRETKMNAIIVECGFIDSNDRILFDTIQEQKSMGRAIAIGILNHLGIEIKPLDQLQPKTSTLYGIVTADVLNVRSGRGINFAIIGKLLKGSKVKLCYLKDNWWSIDYGPSVGYISAQYVNRL